MSRKTTMKELTVISGKGGTGKTSLVAAFASMAENAVVADCDVGASNLHLVLNPEIKEEHPFESGFTAAIDLDICTSCADCLELCRFGAIDEDFHVEALSCEGCGVCIDHCPAEAIREERDTTGKLFVSDTRFGPLVHAKLGISRENSGKLVAHVRDRAREIAQDRNLGLIIVEGSPGIGCPVISSLTGTDLVVVVTEPTQSGRHDLERVLELARHFRIEATVCVNKSDLNETVTEDIKNICAEDGIVFLGTIPYDEAVTEAMVQRKSLVENSDGIGASAMREIWEKISGLLGNGNLK
jgi:MinD superfamily P-loop ATPase